MHLLEWISTFETAMQSLAYQIPSLWKMQTTLQASGKRFKRKLLKAQFAKTALGEWQKHCSNTESLLF